ncbi:MAG: hypothetical protein N2044_09745 [Cyclobacteriaceae bacterium]|nr:hypothetical protein [Cyclobacteriaceae bacterium]
MEEVSGQNLEGFFRQWLYETPVPRLHLTWQNAHGKTAITVTQVQPAPVFNLNLEVEIKMADGTSRRQNLPVTGKTQTFSYPSTGQPVQIIADPDVNLLFEEVKGR